MTHTTTTSENQNPYTTIRELSKLLNLHRATVARMIARGEIPAKRIGKKTIRILRRDVQHLLPEVPERMDH